MVQAPIESNKKIKQLRKEGYSYSEIANKVGRSRKFAWTTANNVSFSQKGKLRYLKKVKGVIKPIKPQQDCLTIPKVRIIAHLLFDGFLCICKGYHKVARYVNSSRSLIEQFIMDVKETYNLDPTSLEIEQGLNSPIYKVSFSSKLMYEDLLKYSDSYSTGEVLTIPKELLANKKFKLELLRAFFEDEGSISCNGRIMADLKDKPIIEQLNNILREFGLIFKICSYRVYTGTMYKLFLPKTIENLRAFYDLKLFDKSIITRGKNIRKRKSEILLEILEKLKKA